MKPLVILEAFGTLPATPSDTAERQRESTHREEQPTVEVPVGLLHRAFDARAKLMAWSSSRLWNTYDAKLTAPDSDSSLLGWAYVETSAALPTILPPLVQCLDDALRRIGRSQIPGFQATVYGADLQPKQATWDLLTTADWFLPSPNINDDVEALASLDQNMSPTSDVLNRLRGRNTIPFTFNAVGLSGPHVHRPAASPFPHIDFIPSYTSISVRMPEWTPSATGWTLATVVEVADEIVHEAPHFAIRVTSREFVERLG